MASTDASNCQGKFMQCASERSAQDSGSSYSKRKEGGSQEPLDQNVAFGTSKNPVGFAATWRNATHAWRWRAVLCLFLSLLLAMMQPSGNALYRAWNAAAADTFGLAVAAEDNQDTNGSALQAASIDDQPRNILEASNLVTADISSELKEELEKKISKDSKTLGDNGVAIYYSSPSSAPKFVRWVQDSNKLQQGVVLSDTKDSASAYKVFGSTNPADTADSYLSKTNSYASANTAYPSVKTGEISVAPNDTNGNMGAVTVLLDEPIEGDKVDEDKWETTHADLSKNEQILSPASPWWALGYEMARWVVINPESYSNIVTTVAYDESRESYSSTDLMGAYLIAGYYDTQPSPLGLYYASNAAGEKYFNFNDMGAYFSGDVWVYANWMPNVYSVIFEYAVEGDDGIEYSCLYDEAGLTWDKEFTIENKYDDETALGTYLVDEDTASKFVWLPVVTNSTYSSEYVANVGMKGKKGTIWQLVNSGLLTDARVDPRYANGYYFDSSSSQSAGRVTLHPYLGVVYDANGGYGGTTDFHEFSASVASSYILDEESADGEHGYKGFIDENWPDGSYTGSYSYSDLMTAIPYDSDYSPDEEATDNSKASDGIYTDSLGYAIYMEWVIPDPTSDGGGYQATYTNLLDETKSKASVFCDPYTDDEGNKWTYTLAGWTTVDHKDSYSKAAHASKSTVDMGRTNGEVYSFGAALSDLEIDGTITDSETTYYAVWQATSSSTVVSVTLQAPKVNDASTGMFSYGASGEAGSFGPTDTIEIKKVPKGAKYNSITFNKVGNDFVYDKDGTGTYTIDALTKTAASGYSSSGSWSEVGDDPAFENATSLSDLADSVVVPDEDVSLIYAFPKETYALTLNAGDGQGTFSYPADGDAGVEGFSDVASIVISGLPSGDDVVTLGDLKFNVVSNSDGTLTAAYAEDGKYSFADIKPKGATPEFDEDGNGEWQKSDGSKAKPTDAVSATMSLTYAFDKETYTVTLNIGNVAGLNGDATTYPSGVFKGGVSTLTFEDVEYGTKYSEIGGISDAVTGAGAKGLLGYKSKNADDTWTGSGSGSVWSGGNIATAVEVLGDAKNSEGTDATVTGDTELTFTYAPGLAAIVFTKNRPHINDDNNLALKDVSDSKLVPSATQIDGRVGVYSRSGSDANAVDAVTLYVPWGTAGATLTKGIFPTLTANDSSETLSSLYGGAKYVNVTDLTWKDSGATTVAWDGNGVPTAGVPQYFTGSNVYGFFGDIALQEIPVYFKVVEAVDDDTYVAPDGVTLISMKEDRSGTETKTSSESAILGWVTWGDTPEKVITSTSVVNNAITIETIGESKGYSKPADSAELTSLDWAEPAPVNTGGGYVAQIKYNTTHNDYATEANHFTLKLTREKHNVRLDVVGGTFTDTGLRPTGGDITSIVVHNVPRGTAYDRINFAWDSETSQYEYKPAGSLNADGVDKLNSDSFFASGTWTGGDITAEGGVASLPSNKEVGTSDITLTYTYPPVYGVTYVIVGGTWADGSTTLTDTNTYQSGEAIGTHTLSSELQSVVALANGANSSDAVVKAGDGYKKSDGTWKGTWSVSGAGSTLGTGGTPQGGTIGSAATVYTYTLLPVCDITFKVENGKWGSGSADPIVEQVFQGEDLVTNTTLASVANGAYTDTDGYVKADKAGSERYGATWSPATLAATNIQASDEYTYSFKKVNKITYQVVNGQWSDGTTDGKVEYLFTGEDTLTAPTPQAFGTGYTDNGWNDTPTTGSKPSGDATYVYTYTPQTVKYYIQPYYQTPDAARAGTAGNASYYAAGDPVEIGETTAGTEIPLSQAMVNTLVSEGGYQHYAALGDQVDNAKITPVNSTRTASETFNVYYTTPVYDVTYSYTYDGDTTKGSKFDDLTTPDLPGTNGVVRVAYNEEYTPSMSWANGDYIWNGWKANGSGDAVTATQTMGKSNVSYIGNWTRRNLTITLHNANTTADKGGTINDVSTEAVSITGKQYNDELTSSDVTLAANATGWSFAGWYTAKSGGMLTTLPTGPLKNDITDGYWATWADTRSVSYVAGAHGKFDTLTYSGLLADATVPPADNSYTPPSGITQTGNVLTADGIKAADAGYVFEKWTWSGGEWTDGGAPSGTSITQPVISSTLVGNGWTFTANYMGTPHALNVDLSDGTATSTYQNAAGTIAGSSPSYKTGDTITLPTASELTKTGYTLTSFTVTQDGATYRMDGDNVAYTSGDNEGTLKPGASFQVQAGKQLDGNDASSYTTPLKITAVFTANNYSVSYVNESDQNPVAVTPPTLAATGTSTFASEFAIADVIAMSEITGNADWRASHTFSHYTAKVGSNELTVTNANSASGATISATEMEQAKAAGNIVVTAHWNVNKYTVTWKLANDTPSAVAFSGKTSASDTVTQSDVQWGKAASELTFPQLGDLPEAYQNVYQGGSNITWVADPDNDGSVKSTTTYTGTPLKIQRTVTIKVVNGQWGDGTTADKVYTVDHGAKVNEVVVDGDSAKLSSLSTERLASGNYSKLPDWTLQEGTGTAAATKSPLDASNDKSIETNLTYTVTYPQMHKVTFSVGHGTWDSDTVTKYLGGDTSKASSDIELWVPDGYSLSQAYVTSFDNANPPDTYLTDFVAPKQDKSDDGYEGTGATWTQASGSDPTSDVASVPTDTPVTGDITYTYEYKINTAVPYTVHVYYQNANPPTGANANKIYTTEDYTQTLEGYTEIGTVSGTATYDSTVALSSLLGNATQADGKITVPTGFVAALVDHASDAVSGQTGVKSDTTLKIAYGQTSITAGTGTNEATVYIDRSTVKYKYRFDTTDAASPVTLTDTELTGVDARYGENVTFKEYGVTSNMFFDGWKVNGSGDVVTSKVLTDAMTELVGTWSTARYSVTYTLLPSDDADYGANYDANLTMSLDGDSHSWDAESKSLTSDPVTVLAKAPVPAITYSGDDGAAKYDVYGWKYKVGDGTWTRVDSPADVSVEGEGYVFAPIVKLHQYTVSYSEGDFGQAVAQVEGYTTFTVEYGDEMPVPPAIVSDSDTLDRSTTTNQVHYDLADDSYTTAKQLGLNASGDVVVAENYANAYYSSSTAPFWETKDTDHYATVEGKTVVHGDVAWTWIWNKQTYHVYFMNVAGSSMGNLNGQADTPVYWNGNPNEIYWSASVDPDHEGSSSIFRNLESSDYANAEKLPEGYSSLSPKNPTKDNYIFAGWKAGSATAPVTGAAKTPGSDISVSEIYGGPYGDDAGSKQKLYVWATWVGKDSSGVRYHNNVNGGLNQVSSTSIFPSGTAEGEVVVTKNSAGATLKAGDKVIPVKLADLDAMDKTTGKTGTFAQTGYTFHGWSTNPDTKAPADLYADGYSTDDGITIETTAGLDLYAVYTANTYKVQWTDFAGNAITNKHVKDYYGGTDVSASYTTTTDGKTVTYTLKDGGTLSITYVGEDNDPFTQEFTYDQAQSLVPMKGLVESKADLGGGVTHNPNDETLASWVSDKGSLNDGAQLSTLSAIDDDLIVLGPHAFAKVVLTYDAGAGVENGNVTGLPDSLSVTKLAAETDAESADHPKAGEAEFTLAAKPTRAGYDFTGWKVTKVGDAAVGTYDENATVYLMKNDAGYLATAQWQARSDTPYIVNRYYETVDPATHRATGTYGSARPESGPFTGTTGTTVTVTDAGVSTASPEPGYTYVSNTGISNESVVVTGDGQASINLYYSINEYEVNYSYQNLPAGYYPETESMTVAYGTTLQLPSTTVNVPAGYTALNNGNWMVFDGTLKTAGTAGDNVTVTGNVAYYLFFGTQQFEVLFKVGETSEWTFDKADPTTYPVGYDAARDAIVRAVNYGNAPGITDLATVQQKSSSLTGAAYEFTGWVSNKTGKVADLNEPITEAGIVYTATYRETNLVEYSPGTHSYSHFSTASKTSYSPLANGFSFDTDAPLTLTGDDLDTNGNPAGAAGWEFDKWVDELDGDKEYATLTAIYTGASTSASHRFVAQWKKTTQTVTFQLPGASGEEPTVVQTITGEIGDEKQAPAAPVDSQIPDGQTFVGWKGSLDGVTSLLAGNASFAMPGTSATFTALFSSNLAVFTYTVADGSMGKVSKSSESVVDTADTTTKYTVKAIPNPGYKFVRWVEVNDEDGTRTGLSSAWYDDPAALSGKTAASYGVLTVQPSAIEYVSAHYEAEFAADPYKVTFVDAAESHGTLTVSYAGGTYQEVQRDQFVKNGEAGYSVSVEEQDGWTFDGWNYVVQEEYLDSTGNLQVRASGTLFTEDPTAVRATGDTVFTAKYSAMASSVMFISGGPSSKVKGSTKAILNKKTGDVVTLSANGFTWPGHTFKGWAPYDDQDNIVTGSGQNNGAVSYTLKGGPEIMVAVWENNSINVVYHNNATEAAVAVIDPQDFARGMIIVDETTGETTFADYAATDGAKADENYTTLGVDVLAKDANDGNYVPGYIRDDASKLKVPGSARTFVEWNTNANGGGKGYAAGATIDAKDLPADSGGSLNLYAIWEDATFYIYFNNGGGTLDAERYPSGDPEIRGVVYGETVSVPALMYSRQNWTFTGWSDGLNSTKFGDASGSGSTYKFLASQDVTLTATWEQTGDTLANAAFSFRNLNNANAQIGEDVGSLTPADKPLTDGAHEKTGDASLDQYYDFEGWYAVPLGKTPLGTKSYPDDAFKAKYGIDKGWTVEQIVKTYYNETYPLDGTGDYDVASGKYPPVYWDGTLNNGQGDFTDAYKTATAVGPILVYGWSDLAKFTVRYHHNAPNDAAYSAATNGTVAEQDISLSDATNALSSDTFKFDGYTFRGWQQATMQNPTPAALQNADSISGLLQPGEAVGGVNAKTKLGIDSTTAGAPPVYADLYAVWSAIPANSVTFVLTYEGDGVENGVVDSENHTYDYTTLGTVSGLLWNTGDNSGTAAGKSAVITAPAGVDLSALTAAYPDPENTGAHTDVSFVGWYTQKNAASATGAGAGGLVQVGTSTVKDAVEAAATAGTPETADSTTGAYSLTLYARWATTGARLTYNADTAESGTAPADTVVSTLEAVDVTPAQTGDLARKGYEVDGWMTKANAADTSLTDIPRSSTARYGGTAAQQKYHFDANATGSVPLYAHFVHRAYKVTYDYGTDATPGKDASGTVVNGVGRQQDPSSTLYWNNDGNVNGASITPAYVYVPFSTDGSGAVPQREGYTFNGFTVQTSGKNTVAVGDNWTVQQLAEAIAKADHPEYVGNQAALAADDETLSYTLTADWTPVDYTVKYNAGSTATYLPTGGDIPDKTRVHWDAKNILVDESDMDNEGFSNLEWYVDAAFTQLAGEDAVDEGNPTLGEIAANWHKWYKAQHNGTDADLPSSITLYAKWQESLVPITFTVSDTSIGWISNDGTYSHSQVDGVTQVVFNVGTRTGLINGEAGKTLPAITAAAPSGDYEIHGWYRKGEPGTDLTGNGSASFQLTAPNGADGKYVEAKYQALVRGVDGVSMTLYDVYQKADGTWPDSGTARSISSTDYGARLGETIPVATLAQATDGFSLDENRTPDVVVAKDGTATLYYNRAQHDLVFDVAIEGDPATKPAAASARLGQYFGSEQLMPTATAAPEGYTFKGYYKYFVDFENLGTSVGATGVALAGGMPDDDLTLTAVYERNSYTVTVDVGTGTPVEVSIPYGTTLADAKNYIELVRTGTPGYTADIGYDPTAEGANKLATVTYDDNESIAWEVTVGDETTYVSDPTQVPVSGATTIKAVKLGNNVIMYLPGDHGTFETQKIEAAGVGADGYNVGEHPYAGPTTPAASNNDNSGKPAGEDGWVFAGWYYSYITADGTIVDSTDASQGGVGAVDDQYLQMNLGGMKTSVMLTAAWKPGSSTLTFSLDAPAAGGVNGWKDGVDPSGMTAGYDGTEESLVNLPKQDDIDVDGWVLEKWVWETTTTDDSGKPVATTYEYEPGSKTFEMPAALKDAVTTVKAVWAEVPVTFTYTTSDPNAGSVTTGSEQVGTWTGYPVGKTSGSPAGSVASSLAGYHFEGWFADDAQVTDGVDRTALKPQRVKDAGGTPTKYASADYEARFSGDEYTVTYAIANDGSGALGAITDGAGKPIAAPYEQKVLHGGTVDMDAVAATPSEGNEYASGNYWDYVMYDGASNTVLKKGSVDNDELAELQILGNTELTVHFKQGEGQYTVAYDTRSEDTRNFTMKRAWNEDVSVSRTPTRLGYTFTGWWLDVPPASATADDGSAAYDSQPGAVRAGAVGARTYGQMAGGNTFATPAPDGTRDHITLRAGYTPKTGYQVNFDVDGSSTPTSVGGLTWNSEISAPSIPERLGYTFQGWYTQPVGGEQVFAPDGSVTYGGQTAVAYKDLADGDDDEGAPVSLYAQWTLTKYKVMYVYAEPGDDAEPIVREYTLNQKGLNVGAPDNANDKRRFTDWVFGNDNTKVDADTTVASLMADSSVVQSDGAYVINGVWEHKVEWLTRHYLYDKIDGDWEEVAFGNGGVDSSVFDEYLYKSSYDWPGSDVAPDWEYANSIPGFMFNDDARDLTVQELNRGSSVPMYTEIGQMKVANLSEYNRPEFEVAVVAKAGYKLAFDYNDRGKYTEKELTHEASIEGVQNADALLQRNKTFFSGENTPHDANGDEYSDPTRPGFAFGGWYNVPIEDINNVGADAFQVQAVTSDDGNNDTKYGDLAFDADGNWYDPAYAGKKDGSLTLYAKWTELRRQVTYSVTSDMADRVEIKLKTQSDAAYSTASRTQVIGAVTGNVFTQKDGEWVRSDTTQQGAVARAKRGWELTGWTVADASGATYDTGSLAAADVTATTRTDDGLFGGVAIDAGDTGGSASVVYSPTARERERVTVSINANGGTYTGPTYNQPRGTYVGESQPWGSASGGKLPGAGTITRTGYTFRGWSVNGGRSVVSDASHVAIPDSGGLTLTAMWTVNRYAVTMPSGFNSNGTPSGTKTVMADYGTSFPVTAVPSAPAGKRITSYTVRFAGGATQTVSTIAELARIPVTSAATLTVAMTDIQSDNPPSPSNPDNPVNPDTPSGPDTPSNPSNPDNPGQATATVTMPTGFSEWADVTGTKQVQVAVGSGLPASEVVDSAPADYHVDHYEMVVNGQTTVYSSVSDIVVRENGEFRVVFEPDEVIMYRLYNQYSGEHHYTPSAAERDDVVAAGWTYEGIGWVAPAKSHQPVYRLYNSHEPLGDHHYTTNQEEYDNAVAAGWTGEGIGWYSDDSERVPLHRVYNPNAYALGMTGAHHYTTNGSESTMLVGVGWIGEGIGWYGVGEGQPV